VILYHYSAGEYLHAIAKHGLTVGDVPTGIWAGKGEIGVWLSSSDDGAGNCMETPAVDKRRFRFTVELEREDRSLVKWSDWAPSHVTSETIEILTNPTIGAKPENWWIYFGWIKPAHILAIHDMQSDVECSEEVWTGDQLPAVPFWNRRRWQKAMLKKVHRALAARCYAARCYSLLRPFWAQSQAAEVSMPAARTESGSRARGPAPGCASDRRRMGSPHRRADKQLWRDG
jgi:hypothetical protein